MNKKILYGIAIVLLLICATTVGFLSTYHKKEIPTDEKTENTENKDLFQQQIPDDAQITDIVETNVINNGKKAIEYNNKIFFVNNNITNPYSYTSIARVDTDGTNKMNSLSRVDYYYDTLNLYNNKIYTTGKTIDFNTGKISDNQFPIVYIDDDITIYFDRKADKNYVFNTSNNIYGTDAVLFTFDGTFIKRINNKIYSYKNGASSLYLYCSDIEAKETVCLDTCSFKEIDDYYNPDEYIEYYYEIEDLEEVNNTILYCVGSYGEGSVAIWSGSIVKISSAGENKEYITNNANNMLYKDNQNIYYQNYSDNNYWYAYSTVNNTSRKVTSDIKNYLNLNEEYSVEKYNDGIYLTKLNNSNKYSKVKKITDNIDMYNELADIVIFDDYVIAYLEYRDFNEGGWRGIPNMYVYYIKKDGSQVTLLNQ